jgi:capsular polysaccharide biosynthesis protein
MLQSLTKVPSPNLVARLRREAVRASVRVSGVSIGTSTVGRFDRIPGAQLRDAPLPLTPAASAPPRTLQPERAPILDGAFARDPVAIQPRAVALAGGRLVTEDGVVAAPDGRLVLESLLDDEHWRNRFSRPRRVRRPRRVAGEHCSLISPWSGNYFHWMIDCLPRFAVLEAVGLDHVPLIVPARPTAFQRDSLRALGVELERTTPFLGEYDHLVPDCLIWASPVAPVNFPSPFLVDWLRSKLRSSAGMDSAPTARRRLLVSRRGVRRLANEEELLRALEPLGFELLAPEQLTLTDQVRAFAEAEMIVGAHGAGLTNMVFSEPLSVLELFPPEHVTWHYYTLARAASHEYWYAVGRDHGRARKPRFRDFEIDLALVLRTVEAMTAVRASRAG